MAERELIHKLEAIGMRLQRIETYKISNNVVILGLEFQTRDKKVVKDDIQAKLKQEMNTAVQVNDAYMLNGNKCIAEMNRWEHKMEVLRKQANLKGKYIYIEAEKTMMEKTKQMDSLLKN